MASARGSTRTHRRRLRSLARRNVPGVLAAAAGAALAVIVSRATGAGWLPALGLALLLAIGLYLFARDEKKGWGDLGEGVIVSVIVAIALLAVQRDAEENTRTATEARDRQLRDADVRRERQLRESDSRRQEAAEREGLQLALTLQTSLRGIALRGREMAGFFLARKDFTGADLREANLTGADLRGARLRRTNLSGANLDSATLSGADFRSAIFGHDSPPGPPTSMQRADLVDAVLRSNDVSGVDFTGAVLARADLRRVSTFGSPRTSFRRSSLMGADFRGATLAGADLQGATLGGARFCDVSGLKKTRLEGAVYDAGTRWPVGFNPKAHGAQQVGEFRARIHERGGTMTLTRGFFYGTCGS
jgi:uncharacterized protein YjbI with pentapeptide repeats